MSENEISPALQGFYEATGLQAVFPFRPEYQTSDKVLDIPIGESKENFIHFKVLDEGGELSVHYKSPQNSKARQQTETVFTMKFDDNGLVEDMHFNVHFGEEYTFHADAKNDQSYELKTLIQKLSPDTAAFINTTGLSKVRCRNATSIIDMAKIAINCAARQYALDTEQDPLIILARLNLVRLLKSFGYPHLQEVISQFDEHRSASFLAIGEGKRHALEIKTELPEKGEGEPSAIVHFSRRDNKNRDIDVTFFEGLPAQEHYRTGWECKINYPYSAQYSNEGSSTVILKRQPGRAIETYYDNVTLQNQDRARKQTKELLCITEDRATSFEEEKNNIIAAFFNTERLKK